MRHAPLILIADDDPGFQEIVSTALTRNSFLVAEAHTGAEAVEKAANLHPDLIIMDVNMPTENGTEAVLDIKKNPETKDIKIVFFTSMEKPWAVVDGESKEISKELGASEFLNKSDDLDKIVGRVKELLSQS